LYNPEQSLGCNCPQSSSHARDIKKSRESKTTVF
jgi:hypothetical protein